MRWRPLVILLAVAAAVLVVGQSMTHGPALRGAAPTPRMAPPAPPASPTAPAGPSGSAEPWAAAEAQLLDERTFSHPVSTPAPPLSVEGPDGQPVSLAPAPGEAMLVSFWATWCPPCVAEMPSLLALGKAVREAHPGRFRLVAVSGDDSWEAVRTFFATTAGGAPSFLEQVRDPDGLAARTYYCAARGYCPDIKYPESYLVGPDGRIVAMMVGARDWSTPEARQLIESALARR